VALAFLSLAGCGTSTAPDTASPATGSPSPAPVVTSSGSAGETTQFSSPELGVSFRYPSSWRLTPATPFDAEGKAGVSVVSPDRAALTLMVSSPEAASGSSPGPFRDATKADLDMAVAFMVEAKVLASELAYLDGLRLAQVEYISGPSALGNEPRSHAIYAASGFAADGSQVSFGMDAPRSERKMQEPVLRAILDSMRFSQPQGNQ
jgi:hypothetical protein